MPFAIERCTVIAARRGTGTRCAIVSASDGLDPRPRVFAGDASLAPCDDWTNYVRGVVAQYLPSLPGRACAFEAAVVSDVPLGGGLSSSASLEVATATMLEAMYSLTVPPTEKALRCQKCEHTFCDTPCGIMDQFISACAKQGNALLIDCRAPYPTELVPIPAGDVTVVIANSNVKHKLSGSEYPDRVRQCKEAAAAIRASGHPGVRFLRDASLEQLEGAAMPTTTRKRARHGISEDMRTLQAKEALLAADYARVGQLMLESHRSLRDEYQAPPPVAPDGAVRPTALPSR